MKSRISKLTMTFAAATLALTGIAKADCTSLQFGAAYREDVIDWTIKTHTLVESSDLTHVKTNLHFKDLNSFLVGAKLKTQDDCYYGRVSFDWGWIFDGRLRQSANFERADEFSVFRHNGLHDEGHFTKNVVHNDVKDDSYVWDLDIGIGYPFPCLSWCNQFKIIPLVGFSYDRFRLKVHDKVRIIDASSEGGSSSSSSSSSSSTISSSSSSSSSSDEGHRSTYRSSWWGPWIGFDATWEPGGCWSYWTEFEFHFGRARRYCNGHTGFEELDHYNRTKFFYGPTIRFGTVCYICENWYIDSIFTWQKWWSDSKHDDITWTSGQVRFDIGYVF